MSDDESVNDEMLDPVSDDDNDSDDAEEAAAKVTAEDEDDDKTTYVYYNRQYHRVDYIDKDPVTGEVVMTIPGNIR